MDSYKCVIAIFKIILLAQPIVVICSCNLTYKVRNQHDYITEVLHFPCGKVTIELMGKGNSKFVLKQKFDLDDDILVHKDSLKIYCNEKELIADHNFKRSNSGPAPIEIKDNKSWEASFELEQGIFEGDTIRVYGPGYIQCRNESITLDSLIYSFLNNLRIHGVNDF